MLITYLICVAVICFSTAFSEPGNVIRSKRSDDYVPCERGWYYFCEKCYKVGGRKQHWRVSWNTALEKCRSYGGDLVSIESQEEQDFVLSFLQLDLKFWIWIGLNDRNREGNFVWSDGTVSNYTNWRKGEPSRLGPDGEDEDCVHLWFEPEKNIIGKWNDRNCDAEEQYICEMKTNPRKRSPDLKFCSSENGGGWRFENSCYHVVTESQSWQNAERHCKIYYNGHLVDIQDTLEDFYLDFISNNISKEFWIGIKMQRQLQQKWSSGWYVSYDGFNKELIFRDGTCVVRKKRKEWVPIPCTEQLPFICEVSKESPPVLKPPASFSYCPVDFDGWRDLGGEYCYYFETEKAARNYYEASFDCKTRGGNLVSLHSKEENEMILSFVKYNPLSRSYYIGLFRRFPSAEEFGWADGSAVNYVNWNVNEPSSEDDKCVEVSTYDIGSLYTWNDVSCDRNQGFICSVKKISPNSTSLGDGKCKSFCISSDSYLYQVVKQSADAKELP